MTGASFRPLFHRPRLAVEIFAGSKTWSAAMMAQGWQVESHDILFGDQYDVCQREYVVTMKRRIYLGLIGCILLATECTTWSTACHPAYRSPSHILGFPSLDGDRLKTALLANSMMRHSAELFAYALQCNCQVWLENPASSYLWKTKEMLALRRHSKTVEFTTHYCKWGRPFRKRTRLLTNALNGPAALQNGCTHKTHSVKLSGTVFDKRTKKFVVATKKGNPYPPSLCKEWALVVDTVNG